MTDEKKDEMVAWELWIPGNIKLFLRDQRLQKESAHRRGKGAKSKGALNLDLVEDEDSTEVGLVGEC